MGAPKGPQRPPPKAPAGHPGNQLRAMMALAGISTGRLATELRVPQMRVKRIAEGISPVTVDSALRLGAFFEGTDAMFWLNLQASYDVASVSNELRRDIAHIETVSEYRARVAAEPRKRRRSSKKTWHA